MSLCACLGQSVDAIDTPALVIDLDAMDRNIARMAEFARRHGVRWRPHAKMHKCAALAQRLVAAGAVGACVQKTAEAEAMAAGGVADIYISNEVIAPAKLARVAALVLALAERHGAAGRLAIAVDSAEGVDRLAAAMQRHAGGAGIDVFVEIDVGQGRCGLPPGAAAVALAQRVGRHPALRFAGLQAYHGKAQHLRSPEERQAAIAGVLAQAGIPVPLVTGAGTGTMVHEAASGVYGELQAGSFLFMDADYAANAPDPAQPAFEHALFVKSQVMSLSAVRPPVGARAEAPGEGRSVVSAHAVCDAGHKSHAIDSGLPRVHRPEGGAPWAFDNGGDEHGILRAAEGQGLPVLGQAVWLIPGHCDPSVNLHDRMFGVRGGLVHGQVAELLRVDARGALS